MFITSMHQIASYQEYYIKVLHWVNDATQHKLPVLCEVNGSCTMTMPLPTRPYFLPKCQIPQELQPPPPIHLTWPRVTFLYSQKWKAIEGEQVSRHEGDKMKRNYAVISYCKQSVPTVLQTMEGP
jgi:hypothetical protein